jgi:4-amino-4-deoxychorismate lyase
MHRPYPHKTSDRAQFGEAGEAAQGLGADDGLMLTVSGQVAECSIWSLFWWEGESLCAPALALGILPGVARMRIAELVSISERKVRRNELDKVSMFVANAARGIVPVAELDGRADPPRDASLQQRFWETT